MASAGRKRTRFQAKVDEALDTAIGPRIFKNFNLNSAVVNFDALSKARWFRNLGESKSEWTSGVSVDTGTKTAGGHVLGEVTSMVYHDYKSNPGIFELQRTGQAARVWIDYFEISGHWWTYGQPTAGTGDYKNLGIFDLVFEMWMLNSGDPAFTEGMTTAPKYQQLFGDLCADHFGFDQDETRAVIPPRMLFNNFKYGDVLGPHRATRLCTKTMSIRTFRADFGTEGTITDNLSATANIGVATEAGGALSSGVIPTQFVNMTFNIDRWVEFAPDPFGSINSLLAIRPIFLTVRSNSYGYLGQFDPDTTYVRVKYHEALNRKVV